MSDVVLVLGMHRSGTSAVAGTLAKLGGGLPKELMPENGGNARGYFESVALMRFHDELMDSAGSEWSDWRPFSPGWRHSPVGVNFRRRAKTVFAEEFRASPFPILKDPRICRFPSFWLDVLGDISAIPHIAMPIRSPLDVARSLRTLHGLSLTHGLLLWLRHVIDAESQTRSVARSIFSWKDFQSDWRGVCEKIAADAHLSWPRLSDRAALEIDRFLTKDLVHHDTDDAALAARADVHDWVLRAYEALLELRRNPLANSALATLDDVHALLDDSSKIFGRLLIEGEMELKDVRDQSQTAVAERDALRDRQIESAVENSAALADFTARLQAAEFARDAAAAEAQSLRRALEEKAAAVTELAARLTVAETAREAAAAEAQSLRRALEEKAAAVMELAARLPAAESAREAAVAEAQSLLRALEEKAAAVTELAARLPAAESAREAAEREGEKLSLALAMTIKERSAAFRSAEEYARKHAQSVAELEAARADKAAKERALAELSGDLDRERGERRSFAVRLEQAAAEARRAAEVADERAAAQTQAFAEARRRHETMLGTLRAELVDAEAALARIRVEGARKGLGGWLVPASMRARRTARRLLRSGLFDAEFYRKQNPEAMASGSPSALAAAVHYVDVGFCSGFLPNKLFDTRWYLERYEDVRRAGVNPLLHYIQNGWREGRDPGPGFQTAYYLEANPDVVANGVNPLAHYLQFGRHEGRLPVRPR